MDMPSSCDECPLFCSHYSDMTCKANARTINYPYPKDVRQEWCPLKPMPEKKEDNSANTESFACFKLGYNACIDELLKGEEG